MVGFRVLIITIIVNFIHHCFPITLIDITGQKATTVSQTNAEHITKSGVDALLHNHAHVTLTATRCPQSKTNINVQRNRQRLQSPVLSGGSRGGSMGSMEPLFLRATFENTMRKRSTYTTLTLQLRTSASQ